MTNDKRFLTDEKHQTFNDRLYDDDFEEVWRDGEKAAFFAISENTDGSLCLNKGRGAQGFIDAKLPEDIELFCGYIKTAKSQYAKAKDRLNECLERKIQDETDALISAVRKEAEQIVRMKYVKLKSTD